MNLQGVIEEILKYSDMKDVDVEKNIGKLMKN